MTVLDFLHQQLRGRQAALDGIAQHLGMTILKDHDQSIKDYTRLGREAKQSRDFLKELIRAIDDARRSGEVEP